MQKFQIGQKVIIPQAAIHTVDVIFGGHYDMMTNENYYSLLSMAGPVRESELQCFEEYQRQQFNEKLESIVK